MKKALVTGGTGFVGSHVARLLVERGVSIRALARAGSRKDNLVGLNPALCEMVTGDLNDANSLREAIRGCDALYHVAADYRLWSPDPQELYRTNIEGTRALLQAALDAGVQTVVYTSTVGALGLPSDGSSGTEDTPVSEAKMIGHYKHSKFLAEREALSFVAKGLPVVVTNPSTPVGEQDIKPTPTGQIIVDFLNRKMPAYLDTGLNLIDVRDVAEGTLLAGERGKPGEKYILGNRNMTLKEILESLSQITGIPAPKIQIPYPVAYIAVGMEQIFTTQVLRRAPAHPFEGVKMAKHKMFFDASKAVRELGLPQSPVEEALRRAVEWYQANGYVLGRRP